MEGASRRLDGIHVELLPIIAKGSQRKVVQSPMRKGAATGKYNTLYDIRPSIFVNLGVNFKVGGDISIVVIRRWLCDTKQRRKGLITLSRPTGSRRAL
jgi:hypothetical protein